MTSAGHMFNTESASFRAKITSSSGSHGAPLRLTHLMPHTLNPVEDVACSHALNTSSRWYTLTFDVYRELNTLISLHR